MKTMTISVLVIALGFVFVIFSPAYGQYMGGKLPPETMYDDETGEPIFPPSYVDFYYSNPRFEKYSVIAEQYRYDIPYMISDGIISQMVMDCSSVELVLDVEPSGKQGWITLVLPRQLIDSKTVGDKDDDFFVLLDSKEIQRSDIASEKLRLLLVPFSDDASQVSIIGVNYPEQMGENACNGTHDPPFSYLLSPLKQFKIGISYSEITCMDDLGLIQKYDGSPACVKPESIPKLVERGWTNKTIVSDIQEDHVVLITVSKNEILSRGIGFDLPEDMFTREDLKKLEQKEIELGKITDNPDTSHDESRQVGKEITAMQDRLQNPFQTGVPYHLVKILKEKHAVFLSHYSDLRGDVWWTGSSPNDISHVHHALRIGIDPDHFTLSELEYQDKKIREYLGNEMNILYKKSGHGPALCLTDKKDCGPEGEFVHVDFVPPPKDSGIILPLGANLEEEFGPIISEEQLQESDFEIASIGGYWHIMTDEQSLDLVGYSQKSRNSPAVAYYDATIIDAREKTRYDFLVNRGVMVITQKLSDPESTYRFLANHQDQDSIILVDGHVSRLSSTENSMPAILYVYPGDDRQISVWAYVSDEDIIKIGKKLSIAVQGYLPVDLGKYREGIGE